MTPKIQLGTTPSLGIGRKDYSQAIEASVEPLISSYQEEYSDWDYVFVPAGADVTKDFIIASDKVVLAHDFWGQIAQHTLLGLQVFAFRLLPLPPVLRLVLVTNDYGPIEEHITKGVPFYQEQVRMIFHNYAAEDLWVYAGFAGIVTDASQYFAI